MPESNDYDVGGLYQQPTLHMTPSAAAKSPTMKFEHQDSMKMQPNNSLFSSPLSKQPTKILENNFNVDEPVPSSPSPELQSRNQPLTDMIHSMPPTSTKDGKEKSRVYMSTKIESALAYLSSKDGFA